MLLYEQGFEVGVPHRCDDLLDHFRGVVEELAGGSATPVRFVVTSGSRAAFQCEVATLDGDEPHERPASIFRFVRRAVENTEKFTAVLLIPTGIGAEIGGHAGDAGPVASVLSQVCDTIVLHPNVVNASDVNEQPSNALYVEGSVVSRLLMGSAGLQRVRSNRVLVVVDAHEDELFVNAAVNSVNAARTTYGLHCPEIVLLESPVRLRARFASSGRAAGRVEGLESLVDYLRAHRYEFDAVALSSVIDVPSAYHREYFERQGEMVNPWGGVEAMLTHAVSSLFDVPSAHCPMFESREIANFDPGIVDPRMSAEAISLAFLQCVLKGLHKSPRIVTDPEAMRHPGVLTAADVSCLVIPDGCLGLPTLAALQQGIPVVAVRENRNLMRNDLRELPWKRGQLHIVENYWEAAGVLAALRAGVAPDSVRRPIPTVPIVRSSNSAKMAETGEALDDRAASERT